MADGGMTTSCELGACGRSVLTFPGRGRLAVTDWGAMLGVGAGEAEMG